MEANGELYYYNKYYKLIPAQPTHEGYQVLTNVTQISPFVNGSTDYGSSSFSMILLKKEIGFYIYLVEESSFLYSEPLNTIRSVYLIMTTTEVQEVPVPPEYNYPEGYAYQFNNIVASQILRTYPKAKPKGEHVLSILVKSSLVLPSTYPENGLHSDGYWYVRKGLANTNPTLTVGNKVTIENSYFSKINQA